MYKDFSDADLLLTLRKCSYSQKQEILLTLYERYKPLVMKVCYYHLADYDLANDIFHDVFVKVMENAQSIKNPALFKSWLMTITKNLCVDRLRRTSYTKGQEPLTAQIEVSCEERIEDRYVAEMDRRKILGYLTDCLRNLDPQHLTIFKLRWKGLQAAQIRSVLKTNKPELRRSYDRIKYQLEGCMRNKSLTISMDQIISLGELE
ncbi:sigma-70 family RNA polymerase sigma factor [bacterium]|nr:sigma-70 family RNA polymerase sigma factor [bacterium]MCI0602152.1 sigma-70 family RNA polymerase sigma factor [bacterium]